MANYKVIVTARSFGNTDRKAYDLLGIRSLDTMMENILDLGLRQTVDAILQKRLPPQGQGLVKETSE